MNNKILRYFLKIILIAVFSATAVPVPADTVSDQIENLIKQGRLAQALSLTDKQLTADSDDVNFLFLKGLILTRQERLEDAKAIFIKLTTEHPELPEPFNNLAVIYAAQGDFTSARQALQKAINTHPAYATAHENLGDIYAKMASRAYNQALELDQDNTTAREKLLLVSNLFSVQEQEQARRQASEAKQKAADLENMKQQLQQTRDRTAQEVDRANQLRQQTKNIKADQDRTIAALEAKRTEAERDARDALAKAQAARDRLADLQQQVSHASEQSVQERRKSEQQLSSIEAEIEARTKDLNRVTQQRDSIVKQAEAEQKLAEQQLRQARAAAVQANRELTELEQKKMDLNTAIEQQKADAEAQLKQAGEKLSEIQSEITKREQDRQELIGQATQERNQVMAQIDTNRTELEKVNRELERLRAERETLERQNSQLLAKTDTTARQEAAPVAATVPAQPDKQDVIDAVNNWAEKWSARDVEGYLSAYSNDFKPSSGISREKWASQRRDRLRKPRFIRVGLDNIRVKFIGDEHARVIFEQDYRSNTYRDHVEKTLLLAYRNGQWLIAEESSD